MKRCLQSPKGLITAALLTLAMPWACHQAENATAPDTSPDRPRLEAGSGTAEMTIAAGWSSRVTLLDEDYTAQWPYSCDAADFFTPQYACDWLDFNRPEHGYDYRTYIAVDFDTRVFPQGAQSPRAVEARFTIGQGLMGEYKFRVDGSYEPMAPLEAEGDCHEPQDYLDGDWELCVAAEQPFPSTINIGSYWGSPSATTLGFLGDPSDPLHYIVTECALWAGWISDYMTARNVSPSAEELVIPGMHFSFYCNPDGITRLMFDFENPGGYGLLLKSHTQETGKPCLVLEHGDVIKGSPVADGELDFSGTCTQCSGNVSVTRLTSGSVHVAGDNSATGHCRNPKQAEFVFDTADLWDAPTVAGGTLKFHVKSIQNADVDTPKIRVYAKTDSGTPSVNEDDFIGCATGFTDLGTTGLITSNGWVTFSFTNVTPISKTGLTKFVLVDASTSGASPWSIDFEISAAESANDPTLTIEY